MISMVNFHGYGDQVQKPGFDPPIFLLCSPSCGLIQTTRGGLEWKDLFPRILCKQVSALKIYLAGSVIRCLRSI